MTQGAILGVEIAGTSSISPGLEVTTEQVVAAGFRDVETEKLIQLTESIKRKTGVDSRYFANDEDCAETLGTVALQMALDVAGLKADELERIIFVSSGGGELVFPATANLISGALGLRDSCDCFDLNNACTGFLTALDIAACGIALGRGPVGIVVTELPSRGITPEDTRPYFVFGDAITAAVIKPATSGGILASHLRNDGVTFGNVVMHNPAFTRKMEHIKFTGINAEIEQQALDALEKCILEVLEKSGLELCDMNWVLPHQPNGLLFDKIVSKFSLSLGQVVPVAREIGSTGAAALPFSLDRLFRTRQVKAGDKILMAGVGGGVSYGAILYEVPKH